MCVLQRKMIRPAALLALVLLTACSTTEIVGSWKDPQFGQAVGSMLVIARVEDESLRRMFEDRFATALQDLAVNAVASYRVFPTVAELDRGEVEQKARQLNLQGVLISRLLGVEKVEIQQPAYQPGYPAYGHPYGDPFSRWPDYYRSWHSYYGYGYGYPYAPTWTREATLLRLETNLYDPVGDRLVWSARSETTTFVSVEEKIEEVVRELVRRLKRDALL